MTKGVFTMNRIILYGTLVLSLLCSMTSNAAGLLTAKSHPNQSIELSEQHVNVVIEDGYAMTRVKQVFQNSGTTDLEAIYSFPVPKKGAVAEFTLWIDGKPVTGEVFEKQAARKMYQEEKNAGRDVALTEQNGFKTFEVTVYPVRANQSTQIELVYYQPADVDSGIGRYVYPLEEGGVDEAALSFWDTDTRVTKAFSFSMLIRSGYPIDAVRLPNHPQATVNKINNNEWTVTIEERGKHTASVKKHRSDDVVILENQLIEAHPEATKLIQQQPTLSEAFKLENDLVVYWRHQSGLPGAIDLVTYKPDAGDKGTFMLVFTPGETMAPIQQGRDWNFVLDISGSMQGKFSSLVEGVSRSIKKMQPTDRFRIILFNSSAREMTQGYEAATPENISHYLNVLSQVQPGDGTNLFAGIKLGLGALDDDRASGIVLVTDGVANIGETNKKAFFSLLEKHDVRLFSFIMGNSANEPLLEPLARHSGGFAMNVSNSDDIVGRVMQATSKLGHAAFHDISVDIKGVKVKEVTPKRIGSLYRGQQLVMMGHYYGSGEANISLRAKLSGEQKHYQTTIQFPETSNNNPELERLWAYATIEQLSERMEDFAGEDHKQAITDIALEYGLVTDFTSMLVMREEQFTQRNVDRKNKRRVDKEQQAQQQRASQPVTSKQADKQKPMFSKPRPSFGGGGGSMTTWGLIGLLLVIGLRRR